MSGLDLYRSHWLAVTGGADGIGLALARAFGRDAGMKIALIDIRKDRAGEAVAELNAMGIEARGLTADVSDRAAIVAVADGLAAEGIVPRILWINAGVGAGAGVLTASPRAAEWVYGVNALGVIWTAQAFVLRMIAAGTPAHVGVTSSSAAYAVPGAPSTIYAASKHATMGIAEALRAELEPSGIGVTIFCPGLLNTAIWDGAKARPERFGGIRHQPHERGERWRAALLPDAVMPAVLETVASGGGYCATFTEQRGVAAHEARARAMRDAIQVIEA